MCVCFCLHVHLHMHMVVLFTKKCCSHNGILFLLSSLCSFLFVFAQLCLYSFTYEYGWMLLCLICDDICAFFVCLRFYSVYVCVCIFVWVYLHLYWFVYVCICVSVSMFFLFWVTFGLLVFMILCFFLYLGNCVCLEERIIDQSWRRDNVLVCVFLYVCVCV